MTTKSIRLHSCFLPFFPDGVKIYSVQSNNLSNVRPDALLFVRVFRYILYVRMVLYILYRERERERVLCRGRPGRRTSFRSLFCSPRKIVDSCFFHSSLEFEPQKGPFLRYGNSTFFVTQQRTGAMITYEVGFCKSRQLSEPCIAIAMWSSP